MAVAKGSKNQPESKGKSKAEKDSAPKATSGGGAGKNPMTQGPARLYGDGDPEQELPPPAPPKGRVVRDARPSPKPPRKVESDEEAGGGEAGSGEADVKPREAVAKGNKTPAVRTTKPKA